MKRLLAIVAVGALGFMAAGVIQEWRVFAAALAGGDSDQAEPALPPAELNAAKEAVRQFLLLGAHLYHTGFDRRFAERLPAADSVIEELAAEIAYLRHRGWVQRPQLVGLSFGENRPAGSDRLELQTSESWNIDTRQASDQRPIGPPRASSLRCRYHLSRAGTRWIVEGWETLPPEGR